jgi:sensor histidine kinase YesM
MHVMAWLGVLAVPFLLSPKADFDPRHNQYPKPEVTFDWGITVTSVLVMCFFYLNTVFLIPKIYLKKQTTLYVLTLLLCLLIICFLNILIMHFIDGSKMDFLKTIPLAIPRIFFIFFIVVMISFALKINFQWRKTEQVKDRFERDKLNAELSYLKAQINPHFLFNTLNSIYTLSVKKSEDTPDAIIKLSKLMRYVISEAHQEFVPLSKEIAYIESYIELEKIRLSALTQVTYTCTGDLSGLQIAPLILISFIENAFKYGISAQENSFISIQIKVIDHSFQLNVKNKIVRRPSKPKDSTGIGIDNSRARLKMIYPEKFFLDLKESDEVFETTLKIELT